MLRSDALQRHAAVSSLHHRTQRVVLLVGSLGIAKTVIVGSDVRGFSAGLVSAELALALLTVPRPRQLPCRAAAPNSNFARHLGPLEPRVRHRKGLEPRKTSHEESLTASRSSRDGRRRAGCGSRADSLGSDRPGVIIWLAVRYPFADTINSRPEEKIHAQMVAPKEACPDHTSGGSRPDRPD